MEKIEGSTVSVRSRKMAQASAELLRMLDAAAKSPRSSLHSKAAAAVIHRMSGMSAEAKAKYSASSEEKREAWAARAFREELAKLRGGAE